MTTEPTAAPVEPTAERGITLTYRFKLVFIAVLAITLVAMALSVVLGVFGPAEAASPQFARLYEMCLSTWQMGFGALVGLLGGKAT